MGPMFARLITCRSGSGELLYSLELATIFTSRSIQRQLRDGREIDISFVIINAGGPQEAQG